MPFVSRWSKVTDAAWLVDKQTYIVTVAPGVDAALLLAICICLVRICTVFPHAQRTHLFPVGTDRTRKPTKETRLPVQQRIQRAILPNVSFCAMYHKPLYVPPNDDVV